MSNKLNNLKIQFKDVNEDTRAEILVDDNPIVDSEYVLDLDELEKSLNYHGKFFILTCESNKPEHIEMSKGINIHKDDADNFHWKMSEPDNDATFTFDGEEYRKSILDAVHNWRKLAGEKEEKSQLSYQDIHSYVKYAEDLEDEEEHKN